MEIWADNYDDLATTDDGSCDRLGCMSQSADNYDDLATQMMVMFIYRTYES